MENENISIRACIITILILACLLLAGGIFWMSKTKASGTAAVSGKENESSAGEDNKTSPGPEQDASDLRAWLGLDAVFSILGSEEDSGSETPDSGSAAGQIAASAKEADTSLMAGSSSKKAETNDSGSDAKAETRDGSTSAGANTSDRDADHEDGAPTASREEKASGQGKISEEEKKESDGSKKEDASSGGLTKLQKKYIRAWEDFHGRSFPLNAPLHNYNWKYLAFDENGRIIYDGDKAYTVRHGIDVSEFQGKIDWNAVRESGIDFVFVRAGYRMFESGELVKDSRAVKNLRRAKKAGLEVGVYVFSQAVTKEEAREEAALCLEVIEESGVEVTLPVVFDPEIQIEYYARINYIDGTQFTDNALAFCKAIKKAGYASAVYANCSTETDILDMSRLDGQALIWYADYNAVPESPYQFTFWQYSNTGWVDGIPETETDLNAWFVEKE